MRFIPDVVLALLLFLIFVNLGLTGSHSGLLLALLPAPIQPPSELDPLGTGRKIGIARRRGTSSNACA